MSKADRNYGLNSGFSGQWRVSSFFIGRSYGLDESDDFGSDSGLDEHFPDVVGRIRVRPADALTRSIASASTRRRCPAKRIYSVDGCTLLRLRGGYLSIDQQNLIIPTPRRFPGPGRNYARHSLERGTDRWRSARARAEI